MFGVQKNITTVLGLMLLLFFSHIAFSDNEPCPKAWEHLPVAVKQKMEMGGISWDPEKAFIARCEEYQEELTNDLKNKAQGPLRQAFLIWLAEQLKTQILPTLSPEAQKQYAPDSAEVQAKAIEWLEQPGHEVSTYLNAYIMEKAPGIGEMVATAHDLTSGESAQIIEQMKGLLNTAQDRLSSFLKAEKEIEEQPDIPYTEILQKHGFSGEWLDTFKGYEHQIRSFDKKYNAKDIVLTTIGAFQTNDPKEKISKMLDLMDSITGVASNSQIPIVSLMGDIINGMVKVSKEMLSAVMNLGEILKKRAGFCIGVGIPGDDARAQWLNEQGIMACPLNYKTKPFDAIYETVVPTQGELLFWDGEHFIEGHTDGGGKTGLQQTLKLLHAAQALGYPVTIDISTIASVYNTPGGIPHVMKQAQTAILGIKNKTQMLEQSIGTQGQCAKESIIKHVETLSQFDLTSFLRDDIADIITTYAASYVAKTGGFGANNSSRSIGYSTYQEIWEKIKDLNVIAIYGTIKDRKNLNRICHSCANALIELTLKNAEEIPGCELKKTDNNGNFNLHLLSTNIDSSVILKAYTTLGASDSQTIALSNNRLSVTLFIDVPDNTECAKIKALMEQARTAAANKEQSKAAQLLHEARALHCDSVKSELEYLDQFIQKDEAQEVADEAISSCDEQQISQALAEPNLESAKRVQLQALYSNIQQAHQIINPSITQIPQLEEAIRRHKTIMQSISYCPELNESLEKSLTYLQKLIQQISEAEKAKTSCSIPHLSKVALMLASCQQPLCGSLKTELEKILNQIKNADAAYASGMKHYKESKEKFAFFEFIKAKQQLNTLECKERLAKIDQAIDLVTQMQAAQQDPYRALDSCYGPIVADTLARIKGKSEYADLEKKLIAISNANKYLLQANSFYKQLNFDEALNVMGQAKMTLTGLCPKLTQLLNAGLAKIHHKQYTKSIIEQAIKKCDQKMLKTQQEQLRKEPGDVLSSYLAKVEEALRRCDKKKLEVQSSQGNELCRKKLGDAAYAIKMNDNSSYQCGCKTGYQLNDKATQCIKPDLNEGQIQCEKQLGKQAKVKHINPNGTYECACASGYQFNKQFTGCIKHTLEQGQDHCRKSFGVQAYAIKQNANGTYECGCKKGYIFNKKFTQCIAYKSQESNEEGSAHHIKLCKQDYGPGSTALKQHYGVGRQCICRPEFEWNKNHTRCVFRYEPLPDVSIRLRPAPDATIKTPKP
jgi:hypothetical protein